MVFVVEIGPVRMRVAERGVAVRVGVRPAGWIGWFMHMPVMFIVIMLV